MEIGLRHVRNAAVMSRIPAGTYLLRHARNAAVMSCVPEQVEDEILEFLRKKRRRDERRRNRIRSQAV